MGVDYRMVRSYVLAFHPDYIVCDYDKKPETYLSLIPIKKYINFLLNMQ